MYEVDMRNVEATKKAGIALLIYGFIFLFAIGGYLLYNITTFMSMDSQVMSKRVEVESYEGDEDTYYTPIYHYRVRGVEYSCKARNSSNVYPSTENKVVYYDSKNPERCYDTYSKNVNWIVIAVLIVVLLILWYGFTKLIKSNKKIKAIKELCQNGKLIKNLPYRLEDADFAGSDNKPLKKIVVDYKLPSGETVELYGDTRWDEKSSDDDGTVDLLIDENDPTKYFVDFEIKKL